MTPTKAKLANTADRQSGDYRRRNLVAERRVEEQANDSTMDSLSVKHGVRITEREFDTQVQIDVSETSADGMYEYDLGEDEDPIRKNIESVYASVTSEIAADNNSEEVINKNKQLRSRDRGAEWQSQEDTKIEMDDGQVCKEMMNEKKQRENTRIEMNDSQVYKEMINEKKQRSGERGAKWQSQEDTRIEMDDIEQVCTDLTAKQFTMKNRNALPKVVLSFIITLMVLVILLSFVY